jgi:hypothetical protein
LNLVGKNATGAPAGVKHHGPPGRNPTSSRRECLIVLNLGEDGDESEEEEEDPPRDFTLEQLREYDGMYMFICGCEPFILCGGFLQELTASPYILALREMYSM